MERSLIHVLVRTYSDGDERMEKPKPKTVEIVDSDYQPTKAEMEEKFELRSDGSVDLNDIDSVMGALGKAMTQPVNFRRIKKPRSRRSP